MTTYPKEAGVYKFTCINNGKIYIGKSVNLYSRMADHKNRKVGRCYFENALIKHGWDAFKVEVLETFENFDKTKLKDKLMILDIETSYINMFDSINPDKGYNLCKYSSDRTGLICSNETRNKMSLSKSGIPLSKEHKEKIRQAILGRKHSEETKEKMRGFKHSEETKEKMRQSKLEISEETKQKMRQSKLGKPLSEEHKAKIKQGKLEKPLSEESRENMRQAQLGKKHSEETKEKIRRFKHSEDAKERIKQARLGIPRSKETIEKMRQTRMANKLLKL